MRRVSWRLLPLLIVAYFVAALDRVNVGFAALQMNQELGLTPTIYGWSAGVFFISYSLFEVPSNLALERFGARIWLARIMVTWGVISSCMAFVTGPWSLIGMRLLLGAAEAGFFPGVILFLTYWFPLSYRAWVVGLFMTAIPLSNFFGSPLSGALLSLSGLDLAGWQWLFILEGMPAVLLGVALLWLLPDRPHDARWLPSHEREWLETRLAQDAAQNTIRGRPLITETLRNRRVLLLALIYFGSTCCSYSLTLWSPLMIREYGLGNLGTGLLGGIAPGVAALAMVFWGRRSDRMRERRWHLTLATLLLTAGLVGAAVVSGLSALLVTLTIAAMGVYALKGPFWGVATEQLPPSLAPVSIATINALGNLGGLFGPYLVGVVKDATGSFSFSLAPLILLASMSTALSYLCLRRPAPIRGVAAASS